jgi:hypothetical protein
VGLGRLASCNFLCFGTIPEEGFKLLFTEAAQHSGRTPSPGSVEDALEQLLSLPASVCARWLDELLYAMAEEAILLHHSRHCSARYRGLGELACGNISQQRAQEILRLVAPLPLEGKSAGVRDVIAAYASG